MANDTMKLLAVLAIAWFFFGQGGDGAPPSDEDVVVNGGCNYAPTFSLRAADKWDSGITLSAAHQYKVNGGDSTAYAGTAISVNRGDTIDVMWGNGNATVYNDVDTYTVSKCGLNQFPLTGNKLLTQNVSVAISCFDENNDIINDVANNYTIGSGETASVSCRISLGAAKKGIPHGAVLVAELASGTVYKEEDTSISGGIIGAKTSVPGAHTLTAAANKAVAYDVDALMATGFNSFTVFLAAESGQNPGITNDITLTLYSKDCYENSDTGEFECGVETEDNSFAGDTLGSEVISVD